MVNVCRHLQLFSSGKSPVLGLWGRDRDASETRSGPDQSSVALSGSHRIVSDLYGAARGGYRTGDTAEETINTRWIRTKSD